MAVIKMLAVYQDAWGTKREGEVLGVGRRAASGRGAGGER